MKFCKMMSSTVTGCLLAAAVWLGAGCSAHESFDNVGDYDTVLTIKDPEYDYSKNKTYAVVDTLADLSDFVSEPIPIEDRDKWEQIIVEGIHRNMKAAGYIEETGDAENADVVVAAGVAVAENWALYGYYPWWGWYGWYYYPTVTVAVDMSFGSVVLVMIDPKRTVPLSMSADPADAGPDSGESESAYKAVWCAGILGLLVDVTENKVSKGVDQAFRQSSYLTVNGGDK